MSAAADRHAEVTAHFDEYAAEGRWSSLYDPANPRSHSFRARRRGAIELLGDLGGKSLLDLGCGGGELLDALRDAPPARYQGVDDAPGMVERARANIRELGLPDSFDATEGDVLELDLPDDGFDAVIGLGLLEYLEDPRPAIREAMRVAAPGAVLVFSTPRCPSLNGLMIRCTAPVRWLARSVTGGGGGDVGRRELTRDGFLSLFTELGALPHEDRLYNKLLLPYPLTRLTPRLAAAAARWAENRLSGRLLATGYLVSVRVPE